MERSCLIVGDGNFSFAAGLCKVNHEHWMRCSCRCQAARLVKAPADDTSASSQDCGSGTVGVSTVPEPCGDAYCVDATVRMDDEPYQPATSSLPVSLVDKGQSGACTNGPDVSRAHDSDAVGKLCRTAKPCCSECCQWLKETTCLPDLPTVWRPFTHIVATCYETHEAVCLRRGAAENIQALSSDLRSDVFFSVDATNLQAHADLSGRRFDCILFNFPHTGGKRDKIHKDRKLLQDFFASAIHHLASGSHVDAVRPQHPVKCHQYPLNQPKAAGLDNACPAVTSSLRDHFNDACGLPRVAVLLLPGQGGTPLDGDDIRITANHWQVVEMAATAGLFLCDVQRLDTNIVPGYVRTGLANRDASFGGVSSAGVLHVFTPALCPVVWGPLRWAAASNDQRPTSRCTRRVSTTTGMESAEISGQCSTDGYRNPDDETPARVTCPATPDCGYEVHDGTATEQAVTCTSSDGTACSMSQCHSGCQPVRVRSLHPPTYEHHVSFWLPTDWRTAVDKDFMPPAQLHCCDVHCMQGSVPLQTDFKREDGTATAGTATAGTDTFGSAALSMSIDVSYVCQQRQGCTCSVTPDIAGIDGTFSNAIECDSCDVSADILRRWCERFAVVIGAVCGQTVHRVSLIDTYRLEGKGLSLSFALVYQAVGLSALSWEDTRDCQLRLRGVLEERLKVVLR